MKNNLNLKLNELLGSNLYTYEAVFLRSMILEEIDLEKIILDFDGIDLIANNFFSTLLVPLQEKLGRDLLNKKLEIINLKDEYIKDYNRVFYGTSNL